MDQNFDERNIKNQIVKSVEFPRTNLMICCNKKFNDDNETHVVSFCFQQEG